MLAFVRASGYFRVIMTTSLCIFEDRQVTSLLPLTALRPVWDLRCGIQTLEQKILREYPGIPVSHLCRPHLALLVREDHPDRPVNTLPTSGTCLFLNGRIIAGAGLGSRIPVNGPDAVYRHGAAIVAVRLTGDALRLVTTGEDGFPDLSELSHLPVVESSSPLVRYPWNLVNANGAQIIADAAAMDRSVARGEGAHIYEGAHLIDPSAITIGSGTTVKPGAVLDAENGPIVIGANVRIFPHAVIEGPAFIGDGTLVKIGAKIYEGTTIGPVCKVGGEVEASILHSHANKQHDGFLGHSYLCPWVNLGAATNNSDLKNNYGTVRVMVGGEEIDSGSLFAGLIMGDHAKSGINTMFNTGTVVGVGSNVFGAGFPPKYIPPFSWGGAGGLDTYDLEKCLEVARKVMERRNCGLSPAMEELIRQHFDATGHERGR